MTTHDENNMVNNIRGPFEIYGFRVIQILTPYTPYLQAWWAKQS